MELFLANIAGALSIFAGIEFAEGKRWIAAGTFTMAIGINLLASVA